ncbi:MAG: DUF4012 domain-containing protein [Candidatus Levybacteria bacterium]|nr:DUF4012 domain-containing protein [Candidatus Levybacteria bacterium]
MDDLPKITLRPQENVKPVVSATKIRKKIFFIFLAIFILFGTPMLIIAVPAQKIYISSQKTYRQAQKTVDAIKKQNIALADEELEKTKETLAETQNNLQTISFLRFVPFISWYYNDIDHLLKAGFHSLSASSVVIEAIKPYADVLGLKGQGSFVMGSSEQRLQTTILTMGKITPRIDDVANDLDLARKEIDAVNPNHYPPIFGLAKVRAQLIKVREIADSGIAFVDEAKPLIKVLPSLLGESQEKKYLVLFQNANELRPTGGFITAYAIFKIDKGKIEVERSDDIYNLDNTIRSKPKAPEPILKYLANVSTLHLRDTNLSPDFIESMKTFNSLYREAGSKVDVDGIIAIDSNVLVSTIKTLDDEVFAGGIKFTSKIDKRCDCPQVIYELERLISTPKSLDLRITSLASVQAQRKDILGTLMYAIMQKALKSSPKLYWGPLVQDMITQANEKHILFYLYDKNAQRGIEALNVAGRIKEFDGDYFHLNQANLGGAKSNLFVRESVTQDVKVESDGKIIKTVTIIYKNPYPPSDCNLERGNLCLNGILRNWFRVYVPKGSKLVNMQGSEVKVSTYEELGKTVFEGFLTVRPQGSVTLTFSYTLPFKLESGSPLPLLIQKQPGTTTNEYIIKLNGKEVEKFPLLTDKEVTLR